MGIIEEYQRKLMEEKDLNNNFPEEPVSQLSEEDKEAYVAKVKELRSQVDNNIKDEYIKKYRDNIIVKNEKELENEKCIKDIPVNKIIVKKAYCPKCGEELKSSGPIMFNPFTFEKMCIHTCNKCGTKYNLEYAYPRFILYSEEGEELKAYGI